LITDFGVRLHLLRQAFQIAPPGGSPPEILILAFSARPVSL
jgi:hypothetical protein